MNYEKDIQIDETALDIEWLSQPSLMMKYTRHAAETRMEADQEKERLDLVRAGLDKEIRIEPERFDIVKITESVVLNAVIAQQKYIMANDAYIQARFEAEVARGAVAAIDQRKTALENLVKLHGQQYFAGPKVPRDLSWEVQERQKRANEKVGKRMRRNK